MMELNEDEMQVCTLPYAVHEINAIAVEAIDTINKEKTADGVREVFKYYATIIKERGGDLRMVRQEDGSRKWTVSFPENLNVSKFLG